MEKVQFTFGHDKQEAFVPHCAFNTLVDELKKLSKKKTSTLPLWELKGQLGQVTSY
ncbi:MAG: hypothetical protein KAJ23_13465 [Maribacter sp.]|nr:hypothetical protein [Maribacter sp.]